MILDLVKFLDPLSLSIEHYLDVIHAVSALTMGVTD